MSARRFPARRDRLRPVNCERLAALEQPGQPAMSPRRSASLVGDGVVVVEAGLRERAEGGGGERMIEANGVQLCSEAFGDPVDEPILLVMGVGASMLWWEEGLCRMLAHGGRFVIRYDHRDTGRSVTYDRGRPGYTGSDLVADAAGVLDAYEISAAHIVGVSAGAAFAQLLALDQPERVLSLVLISSSPALPTGRRLPPPTEEFGRFVSSARVDWSDTESVIRYLVDYSRVLAGAQRRFDEAAMAE